MSFEMPKIEEEGSGQDLSQTQIEELKQQEEFHRKSAEPTIKTPRVEILDQLKTMREDVYRMEREYTDSVFDKAEKGATDEDFDKAEAEYHKRAQEIISKMRELTEKLRDLEDK